MTGFGSFLQNPTIGIEVQRQTSGTRYKGQAAEERAPAMRTAWRSISGPRSDPAGKWTWASQPLLPPRVVLSAVDCALQASEALNPGVFGENFLPERLDRIFEPGFKRFGEDETSANRLVGGYFLGFFKQLHGDKHFVDFELPEGLSAAAWRAAAPFSVLEIDRFGEFLRSPLLRLDLCAFRPFRQRLLHPRKSLPQGAVDQKGLAKIDNLGLPFYRCDKLRCESYIGAAIKMDNIYVLEEETKEIALDKRTLATHERQEKMRRIADLYVAKIEIEGKAVSSIEEEAGVKAWTIQR